jgi:hypothetical protein
VTLTGTEAKALGWGHYVKSKRLLVDIGILTYPHNVCLIAIGPIVNWDAKKGYWVDIRLGSSADVGNTPIMVTVNMVRASYCCCLPLLFATTATTVNNTCYRHQYHVPITSIYMVTYMYRKCGEAIDG